MDPLRCPNKLGDGVTSLFDMAFLPETMNWINWVKTIPSYQV